MPRLSSNSSTTSRFDAARFPNGELLTDKNAEMTNVGAEMSTFAELQFIGMGPAMLRIETISAGTDTIFRLSGRIQAEDLSALQQECEQIDTILVFDLREIQLVDEAAVRFLAKRQSDGVVLRHCPGYIGEWIRLENESK
jgi:hypothetical protein